MIRAGLRTTSPLHSGRTSHHLSNHIPSGDLSICLGACRRCRFAEQHDNGRLETADCQRTAAGSCSMLFLARFCVTSDCGVLDASFSHNRHTVSRILVLLSLLPALHALTYNPVARLQSSLKHHSTPCIHSARVLHQGLSSWAYHSLIYLLLPEMLLCFQDCL